MGPRRLCAGGLLVCLPLLLRAENATSTGIPTATTSTTTRGEPNVDCWGYEAVEGKNAPPHYLEPAVGIAVGFEHACTWTEAGSVTCWGATCDFSAHATHCDVPADLEPVAGVTAGYLYTCAWSKPLFGGNVTCWGGARRWYPHYRRPATSLTDVIGMTTGFDHTCAWTAAGDFDCFGDFGGPLAKLIPDSPLGPVASMGAADDYTCALLQNGSVSCFGSEESVVLAASSAGSDNTAIYAGHQHACVLKQTGAVFCWGVNTAGQLDVPSDLLSPAGFFAGWTSSCAWNADGDLRCWGASHSVKQGLRVQQFAYNNKRGGGWFYCAVLQPPTTTTTTTTTLGTPNVGCWGLAENGRNKPPHYVTSAKMLDVGYDHVCAASADNSLACWGGNGHGEIDVPPDLGPVAGVSTGTWYTCAWSPLPEGYVRCWGYSAFSWLQDPVTPLRGVVSVTSGNRHSCAWNATGDFDCWGEDSSPAPNDVVRVRSVAAGMEFTCAAKEEGGVKCWGDDGGTGKVTGAPAAMDAVTVSAGFFHACAMDGAGSVVCWGKTDSGMAFALVPSGLAPMAGMYAGQLTSCVWNTEGDMSCWGNDHSRIPAGTKISQMAHNRMLPFTSFECAILKPPTTTTSTTVTTVTITTTTRGNPNIQCWGLVGGLRGDVPHWMPTAVGFSMGMDFVFAWTADSSYTFWGSNQYNVKQVPSDLGPIAALASGGGHVCAYTPMPEGNVRCWGDSDGSFDWNGFRTNLTGVVGMTSALLHTCAWNRAGDWQCWGSDQQNHGKLAPTEPIGPVMFMSASNEYTCAVLKNSDVKCWGNDGYYKVISSMPVNLTNAWSVSAAKSHACVMQTEGAITCWGGSTHEKQAIVPADLPPMMGVHLSELFTCAVNATGHLTCWGRFMSDNQRPPEGIQVQYWQSSNYGPFTQQLCGLLGMPTTTTTTSTTVTATTVTATTTTSSSTTATTTTTVTTTRGTPNVECWGRNTGLWEVPHDMPKAIGISAGWDTIFAWSEAGEITHWGGNLYGERDVPSNIGPVAGVAGGGAMGCAWSDLPVGNVTCWSDRPPFNNWGPGGSVYTQLTSVIGVACSTEHCCAWTRAGDFDCFGSSNNGKLAPPAPIGPVASVHPGPDFTCAILADRTVRCWGTDRHSVADSVPGNLTSVASLTVNQYHGCALLHGGEVVCWGKNSKGQLDVPSGLSNVVGVLASYNQVSCAWNTTGDLTCWGWLLDPQPADIKVAAMVSGMDRTATHCAILGAPTTTTTTSTSSSATTSSSSTATATTYTRTTSTFTTKTTTTTTLGTPNVECWGYQANKQMAPPHYLPTSKSVSVGFDHICSLSTEGAVSCWGQKSMGQGTVPDDFGVRAGLVCGFFQTCAWTPLELGGDIDCFGIQGGYFQPPSFSGVVGMSSGKLHMCAWNVTGDFICWGYDDEKYGNMHPGEPIGPVSSMSAGASHTCAVLRDGTLRCFGKDIEGCVSKTPVNVTNAVAVMAAVDHSCAVLADGEVLCWGGNSGGQCDVPSGLAPAVGIIGNHEKTCVWSALGDVTCWGTGSGGLAPPGDTKLLSLDSESNNWSPSREVQCGLLMPPSTTTTTTTTSTTSATTSTTSSTSSTFTSSTSTSSTSTSLTSSSSSSVTTVTSTKTSSTQSTVTTTTTLKAEANIECWGYAADGIMAVPQRLPNAASVSVGFDHVCSLSAEGALSCWGKNELNQRDVPGHFGVRAGVAAGWFHTCAWTPLAMGGELACFGLPNVEWVRPPALSGVVGMDSGRFHNCAWTVAGAFACWGANDNGKLAPAEAIGPVASMSAGEWHTCAALKDGSVKCWGEDKQGSVRNVPTNLTSAVKVLAAVDHSCAVLANGMVRCWGNNEAGQCNVPAGLPPAVGIAGLHRKTCTWSAAGDISCWGSGSGSLVPPSGKKVLQLSADLVGGQSGQELMCALLMPPTSTTTTTSTSMSTRTTATVTASTSSSSATATGTSTHTTITGSSTRTTRARTSTTTATTTTRTTKTATVTGTSSTLTSTTTLAALPTTTSTITNVRTTSTRVALVRSPAKSTTTSSTSTRTTGTSTVSSTSTSSSSSSSSTATTSTGLARDPTELLAWVGPQEKGLISEALNRTGFAPVMVKSEGVVLVAVELNSSAEETTLLVEGTQAKVTVPSTVLEEVGEERAVFVISVVDTPLLEHIEEKGSIGVDTSGAPVTVAGAVSANLFAATGSRIPLAGLAKPIVLTLPVNQTEGAVCAYWHEGAQKWATDGVATLPPGEDGLMICATSHLTMFAAIIRGFLMTITCTNLDILSMEGLKALWSTEWYKEPVALLFWFFMFILAGTFIAATYVDRKRSKNATWSDESFLIPFTDQEEKEYEEEQLWLSQRLDSRGSFASTDSVEKKLEGSARPQYFSRGMSFMSLNSVASKNSGTSQKSGRNSSKQVAVAPMVPPSSVLLASAGASSRGPLREATGDTDCLEKAEGGCAFMEADSDNSNLDATETETPQDLEQQKKSSRASLTGFANWGGSWRSSFRTSLSRNSFTSTNSGDRLATPSSADLPPRPSRATRISRKIKKLVPRDSAEAAAEVAPLFAAMANARFAGVGGSHIVKGLRKCFKFLKRSEAVKDACGDIFSRWCGFCKQVGDVAGSICNGLDLEATEAGAQLSLPAAISKKMLGSLLANYARKQTAAALGLSQEVVTFLTEDTELQKLLIEAARTKSGQSQEFKERMSVWLQLHAMVITNLSRNYRQGATWDKLPSSFARLFWTSNPFVSAFLGCNFWSCRLRVLFWSMEITGALMVATIFFQVSGMAIAKQRDPSCEIEPEGVYEQLGRLMAIGCVAVAVAHIPLALLFTLHSRQIVRVDRIGSPTYNHWLRVWKIQDTILWVVGLMYIAFCGLFIAAFLANVAHDDLMEWGTTSLSALLEDMVIVPFGVGLTVPFTSMACLSAVSWWRGSPRSMVLETQLEERSFGGGTWFRVCQSI